MINRLIRSLPFLSLRRHFYNKTPPSLVESSFTSPSASDLPFTDPIDELVNATAQPDVSGAADGLPEAADLILRIGLYSVIFVFAVVGNVLVLVTLVQNKRMRTVTNVFLVNLAVSDLLLGVFCMPFTLIGSVLRNFVFGELMCKFIPYLQAVSVSVSVWTLVSISMERFFAIVRPLQSRRWQTVSHAYRVIAVVWALSLVHVAPIALLSQLIPIGTAGRHKCRELWPSDVSEKGFNLYLDSVLLVLPLLIMTVVYAIITRTLCLGIRLEHRSVALGIPLKSPYREKGSANSPGSKAETPPGREEATCMVTTTSETTSSRTLGRSANGVRCQSVLVRGVNADKNQAAMVRVIRMLFVVVVEFFVCWTPLYVVHTWSLYDPDAVYDWLGSAGVSVVHLLAYASSCSNPITYCFMHQKFRQGFLSAVGCRRNSSCCGHAGSWLARQCSAREASMASGTTFVYQDAAKKLPNGRGVDCL
ncbi:cholecystokinin receptor type A-like [Haemaphysalis longicornis]